MIVPAPFYAVFRGAGHFSAQLLRVPQSQPRKTCAHGSVPQPAAQSCRLRFGVDRRRGCSEYAIVTTKLGIPDHELFRPIGSGAYGKVWLARNALGTLRAVKIVRRAQHASVTSFEREFKGLQQFEPVSRAHEGLVDILTLGLLPEDAGFYYVMELADDSHAERGVWTAEASRTRAVTPFSQRRGEGRDGGQPVLHSYAPRTLRAELKARGALSADEVIVLGLKLAAALAHLHAHGLVHRDVKPSNILFIGGEPKLADAGLVALVEEARSLVGTAGYIAPEGPGTPRADLYALGKVLYEAAFGKDRQEFPQLPADIAARPEHHQLLELNEIIAKACAPDPKQRYAHATAMLADLQLVDSRKSVKRKNQRQRMAQLLGKIALPVGAVALAAVLLRQAAPAGYARSSIAKVNELVEDGNAVFLSGPDERYRQAADYFAQAIKLDPTFVPALFGLFRTQVQLDELDAFRTTTEKMQRIAPNTAESRGALALVEWRDFQFGAALADAKQGTKLRADSREGAAYARLAYGFFLMNMGHAAEAEHQFVLGQRLLPSDPVFHVKLAETLLMRRRFEEALAHCKDALKLAPGHLLGYYWRGRIYEEMGEFEKAIQDFADYERLAKVDEGEVKARYEALRRAVAQGREAYWQKRLEQVQKEPAPNSYDLATLYAHLGNTNQAYAYLELAFKEHAFDGGPMFDLCWNHNDPNFIKIVKHYGMMP